MNTTDLHGRIVLLTGAGSGIGGKTALLAVRRGADLAMSSWQSAAIPSASPRFVTSKARRMTSTFSCDIAYSRSPAALKASSRSSQSHAVKASPSRKVASALQPESNSIPLSAPRA
jgi:NAD(P)-dependent dehydrogenase (short-subunit alcohol dehydrogenase family)